MTECRCEGCKTKPSVMLMHRETMRREARARDAEARRVKRLDELERLPNGEVIWPDGQPLRPTRAELDGFDDEVMW